MSTAARREEIQRQLQELRDTRERELAAFDAVAAAHPELPVSEITALAQRKALEEVPQSLSVDGVEVSVGARVSVKDDVHLLHRADRGYFAADPLKAVYLGEKGQVKRVMKSFQGKPAVELRFADGVTKVFFVECLALSHKGEDTCEGTSSHAVARHTDPTRGVNSAPSAKVLCSPPSPPQTESRPEWGHLRMPHRRPSAPSNAAVLPAPVPPSPPPTVKEARATTAKRSAPSSTQVPPIPAAAVGASSQEAAQSAKKGINEARKKPTVTASTVRPVVKEPPRGSRGPSSALHVESHLPTVTVSPAQSNLLLTVAMDEADEGLGSPMSCVMQDSMPSRPSSAAHSEAIPDLRPTPGSSMSDIDALVNAGTATKSVSAVASKEAFLVEACPTPNQSSPNLRDEVTTRTRPRPTAAECSGTRLFWLAGLAEPGGNLSEPLRISLHAHCTTMFAIFAVITRKLRWDKQCLTASRLFTDKGVEIKSAGAVQDGMRLVATTGCAYTWDGAKSHFAAVSDARPSLTITSSRTTKAPCNRLTAAATSTAAASSAALSSAASTTTSSSAPASPPRKAATLSKQPTTSTAPKRVPPSPLTAEKPIHIRVYENGLYDDNIYRTVTVRPSYKTLAALKTVITRELQWRDGKKVSLLFDASGAEVMELRDLVDGDAVVASAGNRFVIPYPNTAIHKEAMKLSERLYRGG
ncbi:hypothetical protein, conserved [Leishmania tarentolae]|uniref:Doublecortin domain-containing protein n=1 Tax=Leishmania tarentolae TaxID=5689 RepID=A0A640KNF6_LEITA|nr:hypothetical protein, conserved [Leishmania tarentolae]